SALQVARSETSRLTGVIDASRRRLDRAGAEYVRETHEVSMQRLQRFHWGGDRQAIQSQISDCRAQMKAAAEKIRRPSPRTSSDVRVPRRTALLAPTTENVAAPLAERINAARLSQWSLYWADGRRTITEIAERLSWERGGLLAPKGGGGHRSRVDTSRVADYFEALADLGYVRLPDRAKMSARGDLVRDLKRLGVTRDMDVMVHSSLSSIGDVAGGADAVVEALIDAVGPRGTVLAPSFNHKAAQVYNPLTTPTTNGAIADALWRHPRAERSVHATHAVAAIGARSGHYTAGHLHAGIWSEDSPIGKLVHGEGYLLALGATHWTTTAYHVAECSMPCGCIDPFGNIDQVVAQDGSVEEVWGLAFRAGECPVQISPKLDTALDRRGLQRRGKVGDADCELVRAGDLWKVRREHLRGVCATCKIQPRYREGA
ncbi:MAG: AAC(3) family N-acetyltransferase, partial [Gemmatimonadetes bacterium]|nr:AAC(3) family N-acetyltransferase [Gemmatimonadota bacterium]